jgi:spermidine synthase
VAEIDPAVIRVAEEFFLFKQGPKLKAFSDDGRVFVRKAQRDGKRYDLIMLDAFDDEYIPEHLLTQEFLAEMKALLNDGGVMASNTFSSSRLYPSESATYAAVFGPFYNLRSNNRVILAQVGTLAPLAAVESNAKTFDAVFERFGFRADWVMPMMSTEPDWDRDARVLTDQYSPSNLLNAR